MADYDYLYKVVTAGNSGVGKTSILERYVYDRFDDHCASTIGVEFFVKRMNIRSGNVVKIQHWDIAGNPAFSNITKAYFRNIDGGILVFDLTNRQTFSDLRNWMDKIKESVGNNDDIQFVLVGNKCDLEKHITVTDDEIHQFIEEYSLNICQFFKTSAKNNINIAEVFNDLVNAIYYHYESKGMKNKGKRGFDKNAIHLGKQSSTSNLCCGF